MKKDYFDYHYDNLCSLLQESIEEGNTYDITREYLVENCAGLSMVQIDDFLLSTDVAGIGLVY